MTRRGLGEGGEGLVGADRVLAVLRLLAERPNGLRVEELRRELGTARSTAHRVLGTLRRSGLASQDDEGRYRLSMEFLRLAFNHYESLDDRNIVQGVLDALAQQFGETSYYARLEVPDIVYVAMRHAPGYLHTAAEVGGRALAHRTGLGKSMLAYVLPDRRAVDEYVDRYGPLVPGTPNTMTNASALDRDFRLVRSRGWALDNEENELGVVCIGYPLFLGATSRPSGAVSVAAIKLRTPLASLVDQADDIRLLIERHLGTGALPPVTKVPSRAG